MSKQRLWFTARPYWAGLLLYADMVGASEVESERLAEMSLEQLLNVEVFTAASLIPTQVTKAPGTVYSFSQRDFKRFGVRRLEDLLQFVPGMQINQSRKRNKIIWSRGLLQRQNNKMVLLIDGVRQQHLYYGHFSLGDELPLERIEKVEVILGAASSVHGANAFSGLISVTTKDFSSDPELNLSLEAGDNDRSKVTALYTNQHVQVFASHLSQDAPFQEHRISFIGQPTEQPLDEDYSSLQVKFTPIDGLTLMLDHRRQETPFLYIPQSQDAFVESEFTSVAASYKWGNLNDGLVEIQAFYQWDDGKEYELEQQTRIEGYTEYQDSVIGGVSINGFKRVADHTLALGVSFHHEEAKNTSYRRSFSFNQGFLSDPEFGDLLSNPDVHNDDYALFFQDVWSISDDFELTLGIRYDDFSRFDEYINYRAALVYTAQQYHVWKLLYGTAIRTPSFREYLKVLEGTDFEAPLPDAESLKSFEVGYSYTRERWSFSSTAYLNEYEDSIQERPTPDGLDEYFGNTDGRLTAYGIEAQLNFRHEMGWDLSATLSYVDASSDEYGDLPYIASWTASSMVGYQWQQGHRLGLALVYNDSRPDINSYVQDRAESFVIANLFSSGSLTETLSYEAGIDNLLDDKNYDPAADFGGQFNSEKSRREVWLKLEWSPSW
ncbi:MAG: TonB-dependent receptor plug domain-containing protein [Cellvibrionaceae bacterium]